jgi:protein O-mannosyl-transferase
LKDFKAIAAMPRPVLLGVLFIIFATLAAYWPVFSAGFIWDDDDYVTDNPLLTAPDGLWHIWFSAHSQSQYFPLVFTTLRLERALWGLNPLGYHAVNLCLHIVNALLVWVLLKRLALPGAWLAAAVFALHPVQVETVAWVTELKNTESTMFYLLALFAWLNFCGGKSRWFYSLAILLHALALFAKTTACTLPAAMLLVLWLKHEPLNWRRIFQVLPFLLMGFAMGLVSVWWEKHLGNYRPQLHLLGGPLDRVLIATHAVWFYIGKVFWPACLTFSYPRWEINAGDWQQYLWPAACLALAGLLWLSRRKLGREPLAAVIFFVAVLSPMLGFIPLYTFYFSYVADHYQYLACLGPIALAVGGAAWFFEKWSVNRKLQIALAAALLMVLGVLTWRQSGVYRNVETLWTDTLKKNPRSWMAHTNLGRLLVQQGKFDEAWAHYQAARNINPTDQAIATAIAAFPYQVALYNNPKNESIHYDYGNMLLRAGFLKDAVAQYRQALLLAPGDADVHNNLGVALLRQHRGAEAVAEFRQALFYRPDFADTYYDLGNALEAEHHLDEAIAAYRQGLRLEPDAEIFKARLRALGAPAD